MKLGVGIGPLGPPGGASVIEFAKEAEALGYEAGDARDDLDDDIEQLEEQIDAGEESDSLFDSIKRQFNSLKDRLTT